MRLARMGEIHAIYSSPLRRALATAREISRFVGTDPIADPRLSEFDFGDLEGVTFHDLQDTHPEHYLSMIDPNGFELPFPNGESRRLLHDRVVSAIEGISGNGDQRTVVVAHLVVIATAVAHLTTGDPNDVVRYLVRNCSITHLELNSKDDATVRCLDDVSHLGDDEKGVFG
jgi:broad specificity phosphatase PhoE